MQQAQPAHAAPLYHRRQRSNTAPSATISPLAMLSSSLSNWNGAASAHAATAAAAGTMPASLPGLSPLTDGTYAYGSGFDYVPADADIDLDRTPRRADFAPHVQDGYPPPSACALGYGPTVGDALALAAPGEAYALDAYVQGLGAFDITPAAYDMSPFDDIDFSDFIHVSSSRVSLFPLCRLVLTNVPIASRSSEQLIHSTSNTLFLSDFRAPSGVCIHGLLRFSFFAHPTCSVSLPDDAHDTTHTLDEPRCIL